MRNISLKLRIVKVYHWLFPGRKVTVSDLLASDEILDELKGFCENELENSRAVLLISISKQDKISYSLVGTTELEAVGMLGAVLGQLGDED